MRVLREPRVRVQPDSIPSPFDVEHFCNQARGANYKVRYLQTALVAHAANRSHGAGPEKDVTINEELREHQSGLN